MSLCIIIPTCDRFDELRKTIAALEQQTVVPEQTFIIDDGSPENIFLQLQHFAASRRIPITVYSNYPKKGPSAARNIGITQANADYILFINDDTAPCRPTFLEQHLAFAKSCPNCGVLGQLKWAPDTPNALLFGKWTKRLAFDVGYDEMGQGESVGYHKFCTANVLVPRHFLKNCMFDEQFPFAAYEDIELGVRLFQRGMSLRYNPDACVYHHHRYTPEMVVERQIKAGYALAYFLRKHPELTEQYRPKVSYQGSRLLYLIANTPMLRLCSPDFQLFMRQLAGKYRAFWTAFLSHGGKPGRRNALD